MDKAKRTIIGNEIKLIFFIGLISSAILFLGYIISDMYNFGMMGIYVTILIAVGANFFTYFFSKSIVLKSQNAIPIKEQDLPEYYNMVKDMCEKNNIKLPELYYIESPALNAFATGRNQNDAAVVVTTGLLKNLPLNEISGVVGHELSHILHKDILVTSFISTLLGCITIFVAAIRNMSLYGHSRRESNNSLMVLVALVASLLAPIISMLIKMAVSRSREYMADATGGQICGNPQYLADALYRISHDENDIPMANEAVAPLYISNPLKNNILQSLFSTHPDIEDRIERLKQMK